jgi:hypothetical protein
MGEVDVLQSPFAGGESGGEGVLGAGEVLAEGCKEGDVVFALAGVCWVLPVDWTLVNPYPKVRMEELTVDTVDAELLYQA